MLYKGFQPEDELNFTLRSDETINIDELNTAFPITGLDIYEIGRYQQLDFQLTVARYQDQQNQFRQAIIFPELAESRVTLNIDALRAKAWRAAAPEIIKHSAQEAVFLTWWDNAQRLHLLTDRSSWSMSASIEAFPKEDEQAVWRAVSGGFERGDQLKQLAGWLTMDADEALKKIKATMPTEQETYFLVTVDDLARLQEIADLSGQPLPLQTRVFATDNMHTMIAKVKQWAKQDSTGSYMVQTLPGIGVRAWRIKDSQTENTLLARILPFSHALEQPLKGLDLVYRSEFGSYMTIFRISS